jgi:cytochrome d ubiquinol oxidase subunit I
MVAFDTDFEVKGLNEFKEEDQPPIMIPFFSYRMMVGLGFYFLAVALLGLFLYKKEKLTESPLFLKLLLFSIPLPILANEAGWVAAEVGRQPWIVYHELRTSDAISTVVSAGEILFSLILFSGLYLVIFGLFLFLISKKVKEGPGGKETAY